MIRRKSIHLTLGGSRIDGFNVGAYPLHHFVPGPGGGEPDCRLPLRIGSAGRDEWVRGCFRRRIGSDILALELVTSGEFTLVRRGRHQSVMPGELFLVHPDGGESAMEAASECAEKRTIIMFGAMLESLCMLLNLNEIDVLRNADPAELAGWFDGAESFCPDGDAVEASVFAYRLLLRLSELAGRAGHSEEILRAQDFLRGSLNRPFRLPELCRATALSPASVYRLFDRELKTTPKEYHARLRIERAAQILASGNHSVKEVAAMLGYSSPQYFATEFKRRRGASPSERALPQI